MSGPNRTYSFGQGDDGSLEGAAHETNRGLASVPENENQNWSQGLNHTQSMRTNETATPGMDNLGPGAAGGGISGIALGIANSHDRLSGVEAIRSPEETGSNIPAERAFTTTGSDTPYIPAPPDVVAYGSSETLQYRYSYGSNIALGAAVAPAGQLSPGNSAARLSNSNLSQRNSLYDSPYQGAGALGAGPYQRQSVYSSNDYPLVINPDDIVDDGDDDVEEAVAAKPKRLSKSARASQAAAFGVFAGKNNAGVTYDPVPGAGLGAEAGAGAEKSQWVKPKPAKGSKKRGWIVGLILAFIVIAATVGGAVGGTLGNKSNNSSSSGSSTDGSTQNANTDTSTNGDLDLNSAEIKALMNNPNLHKVFPGMDYTPWGVQYPLCLTYPPSQNNVTRDMAVLAQLTNNVRLYGTDCNQTEMVLHAIDKLQLTDMKLWLGVWIDINNDTTTTRQINQLYNIIESQKDTSIFNGAIIGNEVLYSGGNDITVAETKLTGYMQQVRTYFQQKGWNIPIATSDLGDNWTAELVNATDFVMANIHPFFGGVPAPQAAGWTWTFFNEHDVALIQGTSKTAIISETGWPSAGGNDCGDGANCSNNSTGSVAGISEMNQFLEDWVCQALENGTKYFWFEAFDEPWKVIYDTGNANWEDKWGLMDPARVLKPGLKIPDCGGKTAT